MYRWIHVDMAEQRIGAQHIASYCTAQHTVYHTSLGMAASLDE